MCWSCARCCCVDVVAFLLTYLLTYLLTHLLTYLLTPWNRVFLEKLTVSQLVINSPHFMEPEGSLPHSQLPTTCPYPKPLRPSKQKHSCPLKYDFEILKYFNARV